MDLQLAITRETVKTQTDSVKLTQLRLEHGVATKLDVLQAQQVLDTANAQVPELERQIAQQENAINILLGNYPMEFRAALPWSNKTAARGASGSALVPYRTSARYSRSRTDSDCRER